MMIFKERNMSKLIISEPREYNGKVYQQVSILKLTEKEIIFKNFNGSKNRVSGIQGGAGFSVVLTEEQAKALADIGLRIIHSPEQTRVSKSGTEYVVEEQWVTPIKIKYSLDKNGLSTPVAQLVNEDGTTVRLTEQNLAEYNDTAYRDDNSRLRFGSANIRFNRYHTPTTNSYGETYHTAYLQKINIWPAEPYEDSFDDDIREQRRAYLEAHGNDVNEEMPFV